jgi:hypothetical protein
MLRHIEGIGEQPLDGITAEPSGRQGDAVHHDQLDRGVAWTQVAIRGDDAPGASEPARSVDTLSSFQLISRRCMR